MKDEDKTIECEDAGPSTEMNHTATTCQESQEEAVMNLKGNEPTEGSILLNSGEKSCKKHQLSQVIYKC